MNNQKNTRNLPNIPMRKWWTNGTLQQKTMYAVGMVTAVLAFISSIFLIMKWVTRIESKQEIGSRYMEDRKQSNYVTDEEYENKSKSSDIGLTYKKSSDSKNETNVLKNAMNRCALYDKMINDSKDKYVVKSLCKEANLEYCALPPNCEASSNSSTNVTNQLLLIVMFLLVGVGFFLLLNKSKNNKSKVQNKPMVQNKPIVNNQPVRVQQPIYYPQYPSRYNNSYLY